MSWLKNMDLYKGVILVSLLLLPVVGWWINTLNTEKMKAVKAVEAATRGGGFLEEIGELQRKVEVVEVGRVTGNATGQHEMYFLGQIYQAAEGMDKSAFSIGAQRSEMANTGSSRQRARDFVVKVDWQKVGGKEFALPRDLLFAVLFNCESGARGNRTSAAPSVWKLRKLRMQNLTAKSVNREGTPPQPFEDKWIVNEMSFARREPVKAN